MIGLLRCVEAKLEAARRARTRFGWREGLSAAVGRMFRRPASELGEVGGRAAAPSRRGRALPRGTPRASGGRGGSGCVSGWGEGVGGLLARGVDEGFEPGG